MSRPPLAVGDPSPVWPLEGRPPRFAVDSFMRTRGPRWHAGMDLDVGAPLGAVIVAPEPARVAWSQGFNGPNSVALALATDTGLVVVLGEVAADSWTGFGVEVGDRVERGQPVARVGADHMLHLEIYRAGTKKTSQWMRGDPPPPSLLDPTEYVQRAAGHVVRRAPRWPWVVAAGAAWWLTRRRR